MAKKTILLKGGAATDLENENPLLKDREPLVKQTEDGPELYIGDGEHTLSQLDPIGGAGGGSMSWPPSDNVTYGARNGAWSVTLSGQKGDAGKSAYELAVEAGYQGTLEQWLAGLQSKGGIDFPPSDGKTYGARNGAWVEIPANGTTDTPSSATEQINQEGETNVTFFLPWKFATAATRTALNDIAHVSYRFPFSAGTITKVSLKARTPGGASVDLLLDGSSVLGEPKAVTNAWVDYAVNVPVALNQAFEVYTSASVTAADLYVSVTIEVGNRTLTFSGESDIQPNVYARGYRAATWGADGIAAPDGTFRTVYMPSVNKLRQLYWGFAAQGTDGDWYVCGDNKYISSLNAAPTTPVEITPSMVGLTDIEDVVGGINVYSLFKAQAGTLKIASSTSILTATNAGKMHSGLGAKYAYLNVDGRSVTFVPGASSSTITYTFPDGITVKKLFASGSYCYCLTSNNEIWQITATNKASQVAFDKGTVKDIFGVYGGTDLFVLTEDNELYAKGTSTSGRLGLSPVEGNNSGATYSAFTKVGVWDVKDIQHIENVTFMLTNDGKLYHAGAAAANLVTAQHNAFTQVFENYKFYDIALAGSAVAQMTLVAIAEYLGEVAA